MPKFVNQGKPITKLPKNVQIPPKVKCHGEEGKDGDMPIASMGEDTGNSIGGTGNQDVPQGGRRGRDGRG